MELTYRKLEASEASDFLTESPDWQIEEEALRRRFEFPTYKDGVVFAVSVAFLADALDHHPDIFVGYRKVEVRVTTHDVGGLSPFDVALAKRINALVL